MTPTLSTVSRLALKRIGLDDLAEKVSAGERLSYDEGVRLYHERDVSSIGTLANLVRERLHGDLTFFNRNLHINATNVCEASCIFCSFARLEEGMDSAYTMSVDDAVGRVRALRDHFITEVHIVNGLHPGLPFGYYTDLLRAVKAERPDLHIKGFTAVEVHYYAEKYGMTYEEVIVALRDSGLDSMPGGGAEIFHPRARKKLCHDKVDADGWLQVHRVAHGLGMMTNCTMLFGSIETLEERVDHLVRLRELQDESLKKGLGRFQTFIPLRFHNDNNRLSKLAAPTGHDSLKTIAISRLMLDNVPHIKAYWILMDIPTAQTALSFGANDVDGTVVEEKIYHEAGATTPQEVQRAELVRWIEDAGRQPIERNTVYEPIGDAHGLFGEEA